MINIILQIISKWACKHKWKTHAKKEYSWVQNEIVRGTEDWIHPNFEKMRYSHIDEVLICEECGKIKRIRY